MALPRDNRFRGITTIVQNGAAIPQYLGTMIHFAPLYVLYVYYHYKTTARSLSGLRNPQLEIRTLRTLLPGTATCWSQISILVDMTDCRIFHLSKQAHKFVLEIE